MTFKDFRNLNYMNDPIVHLQDYLESFLKEFKRDQLQVGQDIEIIKITGTIKTYCKKYTLSICSKKVDALNASSNYNTIRGNLEQIYKDMIFTNYSSSFEEHFKTIDYEVTKEELFKINEVLNNLRSIIKDNDIFDKEQLSKINKILDKLTQELNTDIHSMTTIFGRLAELNIYFNIIPKAKKLLIDKLQNLFSITVNISINSNDLPPLGSSALPQLANNEEIIDTEVSNSDED